MINKNEITLICNCSFDDIENVLKMYENSVNSIIFNFNNSKSLLDEVKTKYYIECNYGDDISKLVIFEKTTNGYDVYKINNKNEELNSLEIYYKLKTNDYVIICKDIKDVDYKNIDMNLSKLNKILCYYDEENTYMILMHDLIYYFPIEYISCLTIKKLFSLISLYDIKYYLLSNVSNEPLKNLNDKVHIHLIIHNINYHLCNILNFLKTSITNKISIYDIQSYDGIDYKLISNVNNCKYAYINETENVLKNIFKKCKNTINKEDMNIFINLIDDSDYSLENIYNIICNKHYKNIHFDFYENLSN